MSDIENIITTSPSPARYFANMPRDEYRQSIGMNPSSLAKGLLGTEDVNPAAVKLAWETPDSSPGTIAAQDRMDRGTLAHLLILQPELILKRVAEWHGGKRAGKEWDAFVDNNPGRLIITSKDYKAVSMATNAMRTNPRVNELFCGINAEVALFGTEPCKLMNGHIMVKGQVDAINVATKTIVDLKTTDSGIDKKAIERTVRNLHYREKMAMYRRLVARATNTEAGEWKCFNVFMLMKEPYGVVIGKFMDGVLEWADKRMADSLDAVEQCIANQTWPIYSREDFLGMEHWESDEEDIDYDE